jgi:hypothetical protein
VEAVSAQQLAGVLLVAAALSAQTKLSDGIYPLANGAHLPIRVSKIRGVIVDANQAVIPNVRITLQKDVAGTLHDIDHTHTDATGRFTFKPLSGKYCLIFRRTGFAEVLLPIEISRKGWPGFTLKLTVAGFIDHINVPTS